MRNNQDGSGMLVMARKSVKRPPGKRCGQPAKKTKCEPKKHGFKKKEKGGNGPHDHPVERLNTIF